MFLLKHFMDLVSLVSVPFISNMVIPWWWILCEGIHLALVQKARCPKCLSSKCKVQDLLPNVSLQQAIEHFLESQILSNGTENALHDYVPGRKNIYCSNLPILT